MLVAVSEATKQDLMRFYHLPASRIRVAAHGVEREFFEIRNEPDPDDPYLLCVSTLHPHKNLERLIRVFAEFRKIRPEYRLVIAGMRGFHTEFLEKLADKHVRFTGWIPREDLYGLFRQASAFIYPSTFEGFGMPVLEAMASGLPLACSSIEPLRSIVDSSAVLFEPSDDAGMLESILTVTSDPALRGAGRARAAEFTWQAAARETLAAIRMS
jgi:glycosyltransferase involved in cell wall biosynthesis